MNAKHKKKAPAKADMGVASTRAKVRRTPRQSRSIASREQALEGAKAALAQLGYSKLTMRSVAALSGVGTATIYDYFPSKHALLRELLQERLSLRNQIFDDTYEEVPPAAPIAMFISRYLKNVKDNGLWSSYDRELQRAAEHDEEMQALLIRHHGETQRRYVDALVAAGSNWSRKDLETVVDYLLMLATHFEQESPSSDDGRSQRMTAWLLKKTFLTVVRETLTSQPRL